MLQLFYFKILYTFTKRIIDKLSMKLKKTSLAKKLDLVFMLCIRFHAWNIEILTRRGLSVLFKGKAAMRKLS